MESKSAAERTLNMSDFEQDVLTELERTKEAIHRA